jgi:hypothetical protein
VGVLACGGVPGRGWDLWTWGGAEGHCTPAHRSTCPLAHPRRVARGRREGSHGAQTNQPSAAAGSLTSVPFRGIFARYGGTPHYQSMTWTPRDKSESADGALRPSPQTSSSSHHRAVVRGAGAVAAVTLVRPTRVSHPPASLTDARPPGGLSKHSHQVAPALDAHMDPAAAARLGCSSRCGCARGETWRFLVMLAIVVASAGCCCLMPHRLIVLDRLTILI